LKPCANWPLESLEFGLIIGFLFSANRHLSGLIGATDYRGCLLGFPKKAPFKRCSSYQTHHRNGVISMKRCATLPGLPDD
jgi:hypothetical protein